jgi:beta-mannosidase
MWARAYQMDNVAKVNLKGFSESSQMAASEFTQILSDLTQANYPATAGLMPWSFTVPWPIEFFMFVDGLNQPTSSYYTIKRTYEPTHVVVKLPELLWGKGEKIPISVAVVHSLASGLGGVNVSVQILDAQFHPLWNKTMPMNVPAGPSAKSMEMGSFTIPDSLEDKFFFVVAEAKSGDGKLLSRSVYWPRCLKLMDDLAFRTKYRGSPQPSLKFENGPWLRPQVAATQTDLALKVISRKDESDTESVVRVEVRNTGKNPAFETHVNIAGTKRTFWGTDNDLWLTPGEVKTIDLNVQWKDGATKSDAMLTVDAWNAELKLAAVPAAR